MRYGSLEQESGMRDNLHLSKPVDMLEIKLYLNRDGCIVYNKTFK